MNVAADPLQFEARSGIDRRWQRHLAVLAGYVGLLLVLFSRDVAGLATIYWTSTTYGHCLFVLPIIGWLVWQRRTGLGLLRPDGWWPGIALVALGALAWLLGAAAAVALFRHAGLVLMLQGGIVAILGPNVARALLFPIAYLLFLIPFGDAFEAPLQTLTVEMVMPLLHLMGVRAAVDGVLITTPNGWFEVAEACSGAKFLIAMIAYGTLVANVCYVSWRRRAAFMVLALVVPVLANGIRAAGTIYAAYLTSVEAATGFDHIVYGWIFFGLVMAAVLALGWKWFDRDPDAPWFDPAKLQTAPALRSGPVLSALVAGGVAVAALLGGAALADRAQALPDTIALGDVPGWHRIPLDRQAPWAPYYPTADHFLIGRYADAAGHRVDLAIAVYAGQHEGKELVAFGQGPIRENDRWVRIDDLAPIDGGQTMRMTAGPVERVVATWYRVGTVTTASEDVVKFETLKTKLLGGPQRAVAVSLSAENPGGRAAIERFLAALGSIDRVADSAAGMN